jgi:hypothetical protein
MKTLFLSLCLVGSGMVQTQQAAAQSSLAAANASKQVTKEGVVQVPGVSRAALQDRAKAWFADRFIDAGNPLMLTNTDNGSLIGKGSTRVKWGPADMSRSHRVWFMLRLEAQDGRYRYQLQDLPNQQDTTTTTQVPVIEPAAPVVATAAPAGRPPVASAARKGKAQPAKPAKPYDAAVQEQLAEIVKSLTDALTTTSAQDW